MNEMEAADKLCQAMFERLDPLKVGKGAGEFQSRDELVLFMLNVYNLCRRQVNKPMRKEDLEV
ncbi:hypothetical protein ACFLT7_02945 [candidate division KSB1 bacterium]